MKIFSELAEKYLLLFTAAQAPPVNDVVVDNLFVFSCVFFVTFTYNTGALHRLCSSGSSFLLLLFLSPKEETIHKVARFYAMPTMDKLLAT